MLQESSNKTLLIALKKLLHSAKGKWVDELFPMGLKNDQSETNWDVTIRLTYGIKVIIPTKIGMPTLRTEILEEVNAEAVTKDLDMIDELCEAATVCIASYQQRLTNMYYRRVKPRTFQDGDLVLRRFFENMANPTDEKFQPNREGPYTVVRVGTTKSYALNKLDETPVPRTWNAMHLKRYY